MKSVIGVTQGEPKGRSKPSTRSTVQVLHRAFAMLECFTLYEDDGVPRISPAAVGSRSRRPTGS